MTIDDRPTTPVTFDVRTRREHIHDAEVVGVVDRRTRWAAIALILVVGVAAAIAAVILAISAVMIAGVLLVAGVAMRAASAITRR
jgi:hypothetical protein